MHKQQLIIVFVKYTDTNDPLGGYMLADCFKTINKICHTTNHTMPESRSPEHKLFEPCDTLMVLLSVLRVQYTWAVLLWPVQCMAAQ